MNLKFMITANLMWTSKSEMLVQLIGSMSAMNLMIFMKQIADKQAPIKQASQSKRRQLAKPWLTKGACIDFI